MDASSRDALRYGPGVPGNINPRDPRFFLILSGLAPASPPPPPREAAGSSGTPTTPADAVIQRLMEAELLLQELEEQPREPE